MLNVAALAKRSGDCQVLTVWTHSFVNCGRSGVEFVYYPDPRPVLGWWARMIGKCAAQQFSICDVRYFVESSMLNCLHGVIVQPDPPGKAKMLLKKMQSCRWTADL
jgi:hypothetical protein